jgi:parallel beta-helix repeat protein
VVNVIVDASTNVKVRGNTLNDAGQRGVNLQNSSHDNVVSDNYMENNASQAVFVSASNNNLISSNRLHDNGGATTNNAITLSNADDNIVTDNHITDTSATTNNYGISISTSTSDNNYVADNRFASGITLNNAGTGTIRANQIDSAGNLTTTTDGLFEIQSTSSAELFKISASTNRVYIGNDDDDSTGVILVLDSKNTAGDPTGVNGAMYYSSSANRFRCYENGAWKNCETATYLRRSSDGNTTASSGSYTTSSDLHWSMEANVGYNFECNLFIATTNTANDYGIGIFTYNGTTFNGTIYFDIEETGSNATSPAASGFAAINSASVMTTSRAATPARATVRGYAKPTGAVDVAPGYNAGNSGGTVTMKEGSWCTIW